VAREISIPADLDQLSDAREFAAGIAREHGMSEDEVYGVRLAMSEAVANAIQHGSTAASDVVAISADLEGDSLAFYVRDTGSFRPRLPPQGDLPERGRGLEFMGAVMDEVDLRASSEGTVLRIAKKV